MRFLFLSISCLFLITTVSTVAMARSAQKSWLCSPLNDYYMEAQERLGTSHQWVGGRVEKDQTFNLVMSVGIFTWASGKSEVTFRVSTKGLNYSPFQRAFSELASSRTTAYAETETLTWKPNKWRALFHQFGFQPFVDRMSFHSSTPIQTTLFLNGPAKGLSHDELPSRNLTGTLIINTVADDLPVLDKTDVLTTIFHFRCGKFKETFPVD